MTSAGASRTVTRAALVALVLLTSVAATAQDFARAYAAAEALRLSGSADAAAQRTAYAAAARAFAALPQGTARADALPAAAFAALHAGDSAQAVRWLDELAAAGRDDAWHAEWRVVALVRAGQASAAVTAIAALQPRHGDAVARGFALVYSEASGALCEAADVALREGRTADGLAVFELGVQVSALHPVALANYALALRQVGRVADAEAHYREALAAAPQDANVWNDLGLLLKGLGRDAEAVAAFRKSLALEPEQPPSGPATSNLVAMARAGRIAEDEARLPDAASALAGVLARRPSGTMTRHLLLRELLHESDRAAPFPAGRADSGATKR